MSIIASILIGCVNDEPLFSDTEKAIILRMQHVKEAPTDPTNAVDGNPYAIAWGETLFSDKGLSGNGEIACDTCHDPQKGWSDNKVLSEGASVNMRHSQSLWGIGHQRWFLWDGACDSLWCQAIGPIEGADEMNGSRVELAQYIQSNHQESYEDIFGPMPNMTNWPTAAKPMPNDPDNVLHLNWLAMTDNAKSEGNNRFGERRQINCIV